MVEMKLAMAMLNLCLGISISAVIGCRINALPPGLPVWQIAPYALMLTGGLVSAFQPWMGHWPTPNQVFYSAVVFIYHVTQMPRHC